MQFIEYPKCSTCIKARKYLEAKNVTFIDRHIHVDTPTADELKRWIPLSGLTVEQFFNTSGKVYRDNNYKKKLKIMSYDEKIKALSENGMLIKRPLLVSDTKVLVGFKESAYKEIAREMNHES